ncbi:MAG: amino acid ABC transporter substrate-binding protein [Ruminiclostridium sp.]|nr:amino acid ABC transporter substrate-binding protein [Ruminiclostridium sp.]
MKTSILKRMIAGFSAAAMLMAGAGCGSNNTPAQTTAAPAGTTAQAASDDSLQKILDAKKLVLGLDASFPPMGFTDEANEIVGFDIDVAQEVCNRLGIELVKQPINWDTKEEDLNLGKIDCIWNGMSINPARAEAMNLSEPYMKNEMIFVVPGNSEAKSIDDLKGKTVGVQTGSTAQEILEAADIYSSITVTPLEDNITLLNQMELGFSDAVFLDSVVANYIITENNKDYVVLPGNLEAEEYAIGFRKNDQTLRDKVQETLSAMKADGKLGEISTKWFGSDVTTVK